MKNKVKRVATMKVNGKMKTTLAACKKEKRSAKTMFKSIILSRHPTHFPLRDKGVLPFLPFRSCVRFGSTTELNTKYDYVECNTANSIRTSSSKLFMKEAFKEANIPSPEWFTIDNIRENIETVSFPLIAKKLYGSRGRGMAKILNSTELIEFLDSTIGVESYYFEKFYAYGKEYRLHMTKNGCFYACRKMIKKETEQKHRWYKNRTNCVWLLETNLKFEKPDFWNLIVEDCKKALKAIKLDVGAFDVIVKQNPSANGKNWKILESNSAPSFGDLTLQYYIKQIPEILNEKYRESQL